MACNCIRFENLRITDLPVPPFTSAKGNRAWWSNETGFKLYGVQTIETNSFETIHLRPLHLRPRSFETTTFETCSFETTFIWDHNHLRPHLFEPIFIWDHIHLRPQSFETTFIWAHIYLRPHSFETTIILDHSHFRSHSFYAISQWSCFDLLWVTFLWSTFHFFAGLDAIC